MAESKGYDSFYVLDKSSGDLGNEFAANRSLSMKRNQMYMKRLGFGETESETGSKSLKRKVDQSILPEKRTRQSTRISSKTLNAIESKDDEILVDPDESEEITQKKQKAKAKPNPKLNQSTNSSVEVFRAFVNVKSPDDNDAMTNGQINHCFHRVSTMSDKALLNRIRSVGTGEGDTSMEKMVVFCHVLDFKQKSEELIQAAEDKLLEMRFRKG